MTFSYRLGSSKSIQIFLHPERQWVEEKHISHQIRLIKSHILFFKLIISLLCNLIRLIQINIHSSATSFNCILSQSNSNNLFPLFSASEGFTLEIVTLLNTIDAIGIPTRSEVPKLRHLPLEKPASLPRKYTSTQMKLMYEQGGESSYWMISSQLGLREKTTSGTFKPHM